MSDEIKAGDIVQLKSGGPKMTVSEAKIWNGVMTAWCDWFEGNTNKTGSFPASSLKAAEQTEASPAARTAKPGTWS